MRLRRMLLPLAFLAPLLLLTYPTAVPGASLASTRAPAAPGTMATDPLVVDLQALVDGSAELYSGLWVDEEANTVFVGSVGLDGDRQVQAVAGRYPTAPTSAQVSPVRVARSSADLSAIRKALLHDPSISTLLAPVYSYDGPLAQTGQVELGIVRASPSLSSLLSSRFGDAVKIVVDPSTAVTGSRLSGTSPFLAGGGLYNATQRYKRAQF